MGTEYEPVMYECSGCGGQHERPPDEAYVDGMFVMAEDLMEIARAIQVGEKPLVALGYYLATFGSTTLAIAEAILNFSGPDEMIGYEAELMLKNLQNGGHE